MQGLEHRVELVSSALNSEFKALLLGYVLHPENSLSTIGVMEYSRCLAGQEKRRLPRDLNAYRTHLDPDMDKSNVAYFVEKQNYPLRWSLSENGIPIADLARFWLYSTVELGMGLKSWLGEPKDGGCGNSIQILELVRSGKGQQVSQISDMLGIAESAVGNKLDKFHRLGLVKKESFHPNKRGTIKYMLNGNQLPEQVSSYSPCACRILDCLDRLPDEFSYLNVMRALNMRSDDYIQSALRELEGDGLLVCTSLWRGHVRYSNIIPTEKGRHLYDNFISPFQGAVQGDKKALALIRRRPIPQESIPKALQYYTKHT